MFDVSTQLYAELGFQHLTAIIILSQRIPLPTQRDEQPNYDDMTVFVEWIDTYPPPSIDERLFRRVPQPFDQGGQNSQAEGGPLLALRRAPFVKAKACRKV